MATQTITTRIKNKVDTLTAWDSYTGTLLNGEVAIVRVSTTHTNPTTGVKEPIVELLMKVGDGSTAFKELPWVSAKAADVYNWAKNPTSEEVPVTIKVGNTNTAGTLGSWLKSINDQAATNKADIEALNTKVDVAKVSTAISSAVNVLETSLVHTGTKSANQIVKAVTQSNGKVTVEYGTISESELPNISAGKIKVDSSTTLATKLSSMDAAIEAADEKASHDHPYLSNTTKYAASTSVGGPAVSANKVNTSLKIQLNDGTNEGSTQFTFDGSTAKSINITPAVIGAATASSVNTLTGRVDQAESDIEALQSTIAKGIIFRGEVATAPSGTTYTLKGETSTKTAIVGDMVICGEKEYVYLANNSWKELGDLSRVGTLESWRNNLQHSDAEDLPDFVTAVNIASDGTVTISKKQPTTDHIKYGTSSNVTAKLGEIDASITALTTIANHGHGDYVNQNAFSHIKTSNGTVTANTATDTVEFNGSNITITGPDATSNKITFTIADATAGEGGTTGTKGVVALIDSVSNASTSTAATPNSVKQAYELANTANAAAEAANTNANGRALSNHGHGNIDKDGKITATALVKTDGVNGVLVTDSNNKVTRMDTATVRTLIGAGTSSLTLSGTGSATTAAKSDHTHGNYESNIEAIASNYVKINATNSLVNQAGDAIIFDCGGASN